jgi:hypothetical protein
VLDFPATHKNREAIARVLARFFPSNETLHILEVASGSGQHALYFGQQFPKWVFQPSDLESQSLKSIGAYIAHHQPDNVHQPIALDVASQQWPVQRDFQALLAINLIHIAPWETTLCLFLGAKRHFIPAVFLYGAYRQKGRHTAASNQRFDLSLRQRNPEWGVRCLDEVQEVAARNGYALDTVVKMPANNLSVLFRSSSPSARPEVSQPD